MAVPAVPPTTALYISTYYALAFISCIKSHLRRPRDRVKKLYVAFEISAV